MVSGAGSFGAGQIVNSTINFNVSTIDLRELASLVAKSTGAKNKQQIEVQQRILDQMNRIEQQLADRRPGGDPFYPALIDRFLTLVTGRRIPAEQWNRELDELATRYLISGQRIASITVSDKATEDLVKQADEARRQGDFSRAFDLLAKAEAPIEQEVRRLTEKLSAAKRQLAGGVAARAALAQAGMLPVDVAGLYLNAFELRKDDASPETVGWLLAAGSWLLWIDPMPRRALEVAKRASIEVAALSKTAPADAYRWMQAEARVLLFAALTVSGEARDAAISRDQALADFLFLSEGDKSPLRERARGAALLFSESAGLSNWRQGDAAEARRHLEATISRAATWLAADPDSGLLIARKADLHGTLAKVLAHGGSVNEAIAQAKAARDLRLKNPSVGFALRPIDFWPGLSAATRSDVPTDDLVLLGRLHRLAGNLTEQKKAAREWRQFLARAHAQPSTQDAQGEQSARAYTLLFGAIGRELLDLGETAEALAAFNSQLESARSLSPGSVSGPAAVSPALALLNRAEANRGLGKLGDAVRDAEESIAILRTVSEPQQGLAATLSLAFQSMSTSLLAQGRIDEARTPQAQALFATTSRPLAAGAILACEMVFAVRQRAQTLEAQGQADMAQGEREQVLRQALDCHNRLPGEQGWRRQVAHAALELVKRPGVLTMERREQLVAARQIMVPLTTVAADSLDLPSPLDLRLAAQLDARLSPPK